MVGRAPEAPLGPVLPISHWVMERLGEGILAQPGQPGPQEPRATDICQQVQLHLTMLTMSRTPGPTHPEEAMVLYHWGPSQALA